MLYTVNQNQWELTEPLKRNIAEAEKKRLSAVFANLELKEVMYK